MAFAFSRAPIGRKRTKAALYLWGRDGLVFGAGEIRGMSGRVDGIRRAFGGIAALFVQVLLPCVLRRCPPKTAAFDDRARSSVGFLIEENLNEFGVQSNS